MILVAVSPLASLEGSCQLIFPRDAGVVLPAAHMGIVSSAVAAPIAVGLISHVKAGYGFTRQLNRFSHSLVFSSVHIPGISQLLQAERTWKAEQNPS